jgi:hypothetical protein
MIGANFGGYDQRHQLTPDWKNTVTGQIMTMPLSEALFFFVCLGVLIFLILLLATASSWITTWSQEATSRKDRFDITARALEIITATFVSGALIYVGYLQYKVYTQQAAIMQADQRPWLRVEASSGPLTSFKAGDKVPFPTLFFNPHFKVSNVGKSPAFNAQIIFAPYAIKNGHSDPYAAQKEACNRQRHTPLDNDARGNVLFPGDFLTERVSVGSYNVAFMGPNWKQNLTEESDGSLSVSFYVFGCADYLFGEPREHHQTGFVYEVWRRVMNHDAPAYDNRFIVGQNVDENVIELIPGPSSSLAD